MDFGVRNSVGSLGACCRALSAAAILFVAGSALALQPAASPPGDEPVLKGPAVKDRVVPGVTNSFGQSQESRRMAERIPPEVLREALGVLTRDDVPEAIRATAEQEAEFKSVSDDLRAAVRKYMAEHREELMELRKDANLSGRAAQEIDRAIGRPARGQQPQSPSEQRRARAERERDGEPAMSESAPAMMDDAANAEQEAKQETARQRLRELMSGAPRIEDYITRVWEKLSPAQREAVDAELNQFREREAKRREEMYVRQRMAERQPGGAPGQDTMTGDSQADPKAKPTAPERARPAAADAQRRERLMRLFERLSPEQQEVLLERLENVARGGNPGPARQRGKPSSPRGDKPAPGMNDVDVPRPEDVENDAPPARRPKRANPD